MSSRTRGIAFACALAVLVPAGAASGAAQLRGLDATAYPAVRASLVTSSPSGLAPTLSENGVLVNGLHAENLGRTKALVLAIDRSRSMRGPAFANATAAARSFVAGKARADRIALVGFGSNALQLTPFSSSTSDTDTALRTFALDTRQGTALYDAIVSSARALAGQPLPSRVIVVLTDGRDVSSKAGLPGAIAAARAAGAAVYAVAIEGPQFSPAPLRELATATGGTYRGAASSAQLAALYAEIARELSRTWRLEYVTAARPGERLKLAASAGDLGSATGELEIPGSASATAAQADGPSKLIPAPFYETFLGTQAIALLVGLLFLLAGTLTLTSFRGDRLRRRLAPHVGEPTKAAKRKGQHERLAMAAGLFRATEKTFSHWRQWQALQRRLERADVPLRTVEFFYLMAGSALVLGVLVAIAGRSTLLTLCALAVGGIAPFGVIWFKGQQRTRAFENQLPDLLIALAATLKAGHSFKTGLQTVVSEGRPPASKELHRVLTEARLGRPIDEALNEMSARVGSKNFEFVITAVSIQRQVGGSLASLIDMVADTVRERQQFARKIKGLTAMGRASAYVLLGLPFFMAAIITIMNGRYMEPLYNTSTGHKLIFTGLAMMAFGTIVLRKIVSFRG